MIQARTVSLPWPPSERTLVVGPHPDDETIGCGGTVARMTSDGIDVAIVVLTDGRHSHPGLIEPHELGAQRRDEVRGAAAELGLADSELTFLNYEDGRLGDQSAELTKDLIGVVETIAPDLILTPCPWETAPDHVAGTTSLLTALAASDRKIRTLGYPIWFYDRPPWREASQGLRARFRDTSRGALGLARAYRNFKYTVDITATLDAKRRALASHRSQVERRDGDARWQILDDVWGGAFMPLFLTENEVYAPLTGW